MSSKNKLFMLALVLVLSMVLAACGGQEETPPADQEGEAAALPAKPCTIPTKRERITEPFVESRVTGDKSLASTVKLGAVSPTFTSFPNNVIGFPLNVTLAKIIPPFNNTIIVLS